MTCSSGHFAVYQGRSAEVEVEVVAVVEWAFEIAVGYLLSYLVASLR